MTTEREERLSRRTELVKSVAKEHMFDGDYSRFESALEAALAAEPRQETAPRIDVVNAFKPWSSSRLLKAF